MDSIRCPICNLNLALYTEIKRDEHCDACLDTMSAASQEPILPPPKSTQINASTYDVMIKGFNSSKKSLADTPEELMEGPALVSTTHITASDHQQNKEDRLHSVRNWKFPGSEILPERVTYSRRKIPFYKTLTFGKVVFAVDAFNFGSIPKVCAYFLSHYHSDHYMGISRLWKHGPIYCSPATARLANLKSNVPWEYLRPLEMGTVHTIEDVNVRLMDANHCPGAVMFLFNDRVLHTGDFRATPKMCIELSEYTSALDTVYLDTTYLDPTRTFPDQELVIRLSAEYCAQLEAKPMKPNMFLKVPKKRRLLIIVGSYTIGKERIAIAIAERLNGNIYASGPKRSVLRAIDDPQISSMLCEDPKEAQVHFVPMRDASSLVRVKSVWEAYKNHFTHCIAFSPTGWNWASGKVDFNKDPLSNPRITTTHLNGMIRMCSVPYSEHSSYYELSMFCKSVVCRRIIPTVRTTNFDILRNWESAK